MTNSTPLYYKTSFHAYPEEGRRTLTPPDPYLKGAWFSQTLTLETSILVSKRAYQIQNLYRFYTEGNLGWDPALEVEVAARTVGLCTLESS